MKKQYEEIVLPERQKLYKWGYITPFCDKMTQIKIDADSYSLRVLDVVKGQYGLKNRNDAFKKFIQEFGPNYAQMRVDEEILQSLDVTLHEHIKKYGQKKMTEDELNKLLGL